FPSDPPPTWPPRPPPIGPSFEAAPDPSIRSLGARGRGQSRLRSRLIGGGRGGQLFPAKAGTSVIESHQLPRQQGGSQTRAGADDFRDEAPNYFADDFANCFTDDFRRLRQSVHVNRSLTLLFRFMGLLRPSSNVRH